MMIKTHLAPGHVSGSTSLTSNKNFTSKLLLKIVTQIDQLKIVFNGKIFSTSFLLTPDWRIVTDCFSKILLPLLSKTFCLKKVSRIIYISLPHCSTLFIVQLLTPSSSSMHRVDCQGFVNY